MTPRCIIVTGAASGFGREIATRLARAGEAVVLADLNAKDGAAVTEALRAEGGEVKFIEGDVSRQPQAKRIVAAAVEWKGSLDVLVNNAGISHAPIGFLELSETTSTACTM